MVDDVDAMLVCNFLLHSGFFVPVEDSSDVMGAGVVLDVILGERGSDQFRCLHSEGVTHEFPIYLFLKGTKIISCTFLNYWVQ